MSQTLNPIAELFKKSGLPGNAIPVEEDWKEYGHINLSAYRKNAPLPSGKAIEALVFDIYGTLFISSSGDISLADNTDSQARQVKILLDKYNISGEPAAIVHSLKTSIVADHAMKKKQGIDYPEVEIREIWRGIAEFSHLSEDAISLFAAEYEAAVNPVAPMPGLQDLLHCPALSGLPLGIVSNAQFYTPALFQAFLAQSVEGLGFHPDLLIYSFREGYAKPSLRLYEILTERLKNLARPILPGQTLYVGNDMLKDVWAAAQLGFQTALFAGDRRSFRPRSSDQRCKNLKADYVIDRLDDICLLLTN